MLKTRLWYKNWWAIPLVILILPLFGLWYVWVELERSKKFRLGVTAFLLALYAGGVMSLVYALPNSSHPSTATSKNISTSSKSLDTSKLSSNVAVSSEPTATNKTAQTTSKASSTTSPNKAVTTSPTATSSPIISSTTSQTTTTAPAETLLQQYPDTYPADAVNSNGQHWGYDYPLDSTTDNWNMDNRESVSYTAWKVNETFSNIPNISNMLSELGNANSWPQNAQSEGIPTGQTPELHSVAIRPNPTTGFSAWVEAVNGNQVTVSAYNQDSTGNYSVFTEPASYFTTYIYFGNQ